MSAWGCCSSHQFIEIESVSRFRGEVDHVFVAQVLISITLGTVVRRDAITAILTELVTAELLVPGSAVRPIHLV